MSGRFGYLSKVNGRPRAVVDSAPQHAELATDVEADVLQRQGE
ncbi:hypothetical protein O7635_23955 [Asanoa sp. WMMD1127]|nr:hypothetical protein [Asanoa sp. WMMD1127]MDG4824915.1 hypothetical protein [Asanoa sp. WMMD1127]